MKKTCFLRTVPIILALIMIIDFMPFCPIVSHGAELRPKASEIPTSTLVIGTHLIHIKGLNSELLDIAAKSAESSMQGKIYYKSEFANGVWFDISDASDFTAISSDGKAVSNSIIDALTLTHWTKEDGKTYELSSGNVVDIHKINDPSNFSNLPELAELVTRKSMVQETISRENTNENRKKLESLKRILDVPFSSTEFASIVGKMDALEKYINYLKGKKTNENWVNAVIEIKGELDTDRLILCYQEVLLRLNAEITFVENGIKDEDGKKAPAMDLSTAYYTCLDLVNKKIAELESSRSAQDASGALDSEGMKYKNSLKSYAIDGKYEMADTNLEKYMSAKDILGGLKLNIPLELSILKPLLPNVSKELFSLAVAGLPKAYYTSQKAGEPKAILDSIKMSFLGKLTSLSSDTKSILGYIKERESDKLVLEAIISPIIKGCIDTLLKLPEDAAKSESFDILKQLINSLNAELSLLKEGSMDNSLSGKLKDLDKQIDTLTTDYLSALDERNLSLAQSIKEEIDRLSEQKAEIYENASLEQSKLFQKKAELEALLEDALAKGDGTTAGKLLDQLSSLNASLSIQGKSVDSLTSVINTAISDLFGELEKLLSENNFADALSKTNEIYDMIKASPSTSAISLSLLKNLLPKVQTKLENANKNDKSTDVKYLEKISSIIDGLLGTVSDSQQQKAADDTALKGALSSNLISMLSKSGISLDSSKGQLLKTLLLDAFKKNPEYSKITGWINNMQDDAAALLNSMGADYIVDDSRYISGIRYANLRELADISGRRYVWRKDTGTASIARGRSSMIFKKGKIDITIDGKSQKMSSSTTIIKNSVYVPLSFVASKLGYSCIFVGKNQKPMLYPKSFDKTISDLLK